MNMKIMLSASALVLALTLASPTMPSATAVEQPDCSDAVDRCGIVLTADGSTGLWDLQVGGNLVCDTTSTAGTLNAGDPVSFSISCVDIGTIAETTCLGVAAETETQDNAEASADMQCGTLSASCSSETDGGEYDYCWDEDFGNSSPPIDCDLHADAAWWDYGSYARATCYIWYEENST